MGVWKQSLTVLFLALSCSHASTQPVVSKAPMEHPVTQHVDSASHEGVRQELARRWELSPELVQVTDLNTTCPGVMAFVAQRTDRKGRRGAWSAGVATSQGVETRRQEAITQLLRACGYGPSRTVAAMEFARLVGQIELTTEPTRPILTQQDVDGLLPAWRALVALPQEVERDGHPGVQYWVRCGEPPLWRTTVVVTPEGVIRESKSVTDFSSGG